MVLNIFATLAQFERWLIHERKQAKRQRILDQANEGRLEAKAKGVQFGRK